MISQFLTKVGYFFKNGKISLTSAQTYLISPNQRQLEKMTILLCIFLFHKLGFLCKSKVINYSANDEKYS